MTTAILIIGALILISEFADWATYGGFIPEPKLHLLEDKLKMPALSSKGMIHWGNGYFACKKWGLLSRWYIQKGGDKKRIFITSKMNKMLDDKYRELRQIELKNKSTELV